MMMMKKNVTKEKLKIPEGEVWNNEFDYGAFEEDAMDRPTVPPIKEMDL